MEAPTPMCLSINEPHMFTLTQFNQPNCPHIYATRFGLYVGQLQACRYKKDIQGGNTNVSAV